MNAAFLCLLAAVLAGGASTLLELVWLRAAGAALPGTVPAGSLVLPVFLLAWTVGSAVAGRSADRTGARLGRAARWLAAGAGFAVLAPRALEAWLPAAPPTSLALRLALGAAPVVPAAFCLAGALPLLARVRHAAGLPAARATGAVAAAVSAGGLAGCVLTVPVLRWAGTGTVAAAGCLAAAALACAFLSLFERTGREAAQRDEGPGALAPGLSAFLGGVLLVAGQLGVLRVAAQFRGDSLATTAEIVGAVHAGMAVGALLLVWLGTRLTVSATMGLLLALAGAGLMVSAWALPWLAVRTPWECALALGLPLGLGAGSLVTAASRAGVRPAGRFGAWVGDLAALSTAGGVAGGLAYTWWWMPAPDAGTGGALRGLALAGCGLAVLLSWLGRSRRRGGLTLLWTVPTLVLVVLSEPLDVTAMPGPADEVRVLQASEGPYGVVTLAATDDGGTRLSIDHRFALGGSRGARLQRRLGRVAASFHPGAREALMLGLGRGHTLAGLAATTRAHVTCVERNAQILALGLEIPFEPGSRPRGGVPTIVHDDARAHLLAHPASYDLIVGDLFFPWMTGAGDLLSVEQFAAMRRALRPEGVVVQWLPGHQLPWAALGCVVQAFREQFPSARLFVAQPLAPEPLLALVGGLSAALPDPVEVDELLATSPSDGGPHGAVDVHDLHVADFWTLRERFGDRPVNRRAAPWSELLTLRREGDEASLARINTALLADMVGALNTFDLGRRPTSAEQDRRLGAELAARAAALQGVLMARAAQLELEWMPDVVFWDLQRETAETRLATALVAAWRAFPGHLGVRQALMERVAELRRAGRGELAAALLATIHEEYADVTLDGVYGELLLWLGLPDRAREVLADALGRAPDNRSLLLLLGTLHCWEGEDEQARDVLSRARALASDGRLPVLQGVALGLLEGRLAAVDLARQLVGELSPDDPWTRCLRRLQRALDPDRAR